MSGRKDEEHSLEEGHGLLDEHKRPFDKPEPSRRSWFLQFWKFLAALVLTVSLAMNIIQAASLRRFGGQEPGCPSPYGMLYSEDPNLCIQLMSSAASVSTGTTREFVTNTEWSSDNITHNDWLWGNITPNAGMVAISKAYSASTNQYQTELFPWDHTKGIYMIEAYHSLHCLEYMYRAFREFEQGLPQTVAVHHHYHCLDSLRENAICHADDTLRPAGTGNATPMVKDKKPQRQCRDWDQLERWAVENSACFRRATDDSPDRKTLNEWRWCPEGSLYGPVVDDYFERHGPDESV